MKLPGKHFPLETKTLVDKETYIHKYHFVYVTCCFMSFYTFCYNLLVLAFMQVKRDGLYGLLLCVAIVHTCVPSNSSNNLWWGYSGDRRYKLSHNKIMWTYFHKIEFFYHLCLLKLWHLMGYCPSFRSDILINSHSLSDSIITDRSHISCTNTQLCSQRFRNLDYASQFQFNIHAAVKMVRQVMKGHQISCLVSYQHVLLHAWYFFLSFLGEINELIWINWNFRGRRKIQNSIITV